MLNYTMSSGSPEFKEQLASFLDEFVFYNTKEDTEIIPTAADEIVVSPGVASLLVQLSLLLFNPGDSVLVPIPYYPAFDHDFSNFGDVTTVPVDFLADGDPHPNLDPDLEPFGRPCEAALEKAFQRALHAGMPPKALLLTNPGNPTGSIYASQDLLLMVQWCRRKGLHLIVDEIYALSVFADTHQGLGFRSVVGLLGGRLGGQVHVLWGFSKDFGASGLRVGVLRSQNRDLLRALGSTNEAMQVSGLAQYALATLVQDRSFVRAYITANQQRLHTAHLKLSSALSKLGIPYISSQGGIFIFINLGKYLKEDSFEAEGAFFDLLHSKYALVLTPGRPCHCRIPGYFRICYAYYKEWDIAIDRCIRQLTLLVQDMS